jgi:hypothetical protein
MPGYQHITSIAASLHTDEEALLDFRRMGCITAVERRKARPTGKIVRFSSRPVVRA